MLKEYIHNNLLDLVKFTSQKNKNGFYEVKNNDFELIYDLDEDRLTLMWILVKSTKFKGKDIFKSLIELAEENKINKITGWGVSGKIDNVEAKGNYALMKWGFVPDKGINFINKTLKTNYNSIEEAWEDPEFWKKWKETKKDYVGTFDLSPNSLSMKQFNKINVFSKTHQLVQEESNLISFKEILHKLLLEQTYELGCVMIGVNFPEINKIHDAIDPNDVYTENDGEDFGIIKDSHITALYGVHSDRVDDNDVMGLIKDINIGDIILSGVSTFKNAKFDVLKFDVVSEKLHEINKLLRDNFPYTNDYDVYHPHCTICYLKPGTGEKYIKKWKDYSFTLTPNEIIYSKPDGEKIITPIKKEKTINESIKKNKELIFYHGTNHDIKNFSNEFVGADEAKDQEGPGIYFTSSKDDAEMYGKNVYEVKLKPRKLISTTKNANPKEIFFLIKNAPNWKDTVQNWGENINYALKEAINAIMEYDDNQHQQFQQVWIDFYRHNPIEYVKNVIKLGYDAVLIKKQNNVNHIIVLNPAIIEFNEMKETLQENNLNDNFWKWFSGSKVVDSKGNPQVVHHGTGNKFNKFNLNKATQKIIWFTSDKSAIEAGEVGAQGKGHIMDLYVSMKNPAGWEEYQKYGLGQLIDLGYDGAILPDNDRATGITIDKSDTFTGFVFKPNQLKSVLNKGDWDANNNNILKENNSPIKKILDSEEAYEILDSTKAEGSTWTSGGCAILAFALNKLYNYPVYVIYNEDNKIVEHLVVKTPQGTFIDYDGERKDIIKSYKKLEWEIANDNLRVIEYNSNMDFGDIVIDDKASEKLAKLIKNNKSSLTETTNKDIRIDFDSQKNSKDILLNDKIIGKLSLMHRDNGYLVLDLIEINEPYRNSGYATKAMNHLIDYANKHNYILTLTPDTFKGSNRNKLIKWYQSFGFIINKGKQKDFRTMQMMYKLPKKLNESNNIGKSEKKQAAGVLIFAKSTGKFLLLKRNEGDCKNTWAMPGGGIEKGETRLKGLFRELKEEIGLENPNESLSNLTMIFKNEVKDDFDYFNYIAKSNKEFEPKLNNEHNNFGWFDKNSLPENIHPGVKDLFNKLKLTNGLNEENDKKEVPIEKLNYWEMIFKKSPNKLSDLALKIITTIKNSGNKATQKQINYINKALRGG